MQIAKLTFLQKLCESSCIYNIVYCLKIIWTYLARNTRLHIIFSPAVMTYNMRLIISICAHTMSRNTYLNLIVLEQKCFYFIYT